MTNLEQEALERATSPFWRRVVKIVHLPLFTITHAVVHFGWYRFARLFSLPEEKVWSPQKLRSWIRDKATGFQAYSVEQNARTTKSSASDAQRIRQRTEWLMSHADGANALLMEKKAIVDRIIQHLSSRQSGWVHMNDTERRGLACARSLDSLPDELRINTLALATEAIRHHTRGIRLHDSQLMAASCLTKNYFIQLRNGEGKTYVGVLAMVWAAVRMQAVQRVARQHNVTAPLTTCYILTANDYLVRRDFTWLRGVFESVGISIAYLQTKDVSLSLKRLVHSADIVMMTGSEFGFDHLRDSSREYEVASLGLRPYYVLVDEADQLLLDEARTPLILSGPPKDVSAAAVQVAWVQQVDQWITTVFQPNACIIMNARGDLDLSVAGRIFIRSLLQEHGMADWGDLRGFLQRHRGRDLAALLGQFLLATPGASGDATTAAVQDLHRALESYPVYVLRRKEGTAQGRSEICLTREGRQLVAELVSALLGPGRKGEIRELISWAVIEARKAAIPAELLSRIQRWGKRRVLSLAVRSLFKRDWLVAGVEVLLRAAAEMSGNACIPDTFTNGLCELLQSHRAGSDGATGNAPEWIVSCAIPALANLVVPTVQTVILEPGKGTRSELSFFLLMIQALSKTPGLRYPALLYCRLATTESVCTWTTFS
ncbi:MAG: hypothetical protein KAV00_15255 [Phycisphaerae bacterium]|nr:hypothetical protein [Phycisphaerae bacterium]